MAADDERPGRRAVPRVRTEDIDGAADGSSTAPPGSSLADLVEQARPDERTADAPDVTRSPHFRSLAAMPPSSEPTQAQGGSTVTFGAVARPVVDIAPEIDERHPAVAERTHLLDMGVFARGGFGSIHRVHDRRFHRRVAMKVLEADDARAHSRFIQEGQVTAQLAHPNIVAVHEAGLDPDGRPFFTMQLVKGETLARVVERTDVDKASELHGLIQVFLRICDAVRFAHARGVVHRDLKPENVMVGRYGQVYVMDWGIALVRATPGADGADPDEDLVEIEGARLVVTDRAGTVVGTPSYMAPEQAQGRVDDIDERTDVFALGAILYFILTGTAPYRGATSQEKLVKAQTCDVEPPEQRAPERRIPPALRQITVRAMQEHPERRYPTVRALQQDLEAFLRGGWWFESRTFAPGDVVLREGDEGEAAYIITGGAAEVFRHGAEGEVLLATMGPGEVFGETALLTRSPRIASVRATSPLTVMVVTRETIEDRLSSDSWMAQIVSTLARRFRAAEVSSRTDVGARPTVIPGAAVRPAMASTTRTVSSTAPPELDASSRRASSSSASSSDPPVEVLPLSAITPLPPLAGDADGDVAGSRLGSQRIADLLAGIARDEDVDALARLYESLDGSLGPQLVDWAVDAPPSSRRTLARVLMAARDYAPAAEVFRRAGAPLDAAPLFERAGLYLDAGEAYREGGEHVLAAHAFERAGDVDAALRALDAAGLDAERTALLVRAGRFADAASVVHAQGDHAMEVAILRRVPLRHPFRGEATERLAALLVAAGRDDEATTFVRDTLGAGLDAATAARLGQLLVGLYESSGKPEEAVRLREWLLDVGVDASFSTDAALDGGHRAPVELADAPREASSSDDAYARLKALPLFSALSLVELKDLLAQSEERTASAGELVLEQGAACPGLFVVVRGALARTRGGEREEVLADGATVGEVALLTGAPSDVRVRATVDTALLVFERARLQRWLDTHEAAARAIYRTLATTLAHRVQGTPGDLR